jgi:N,N-dimethylformamidase
MTLAATTNGGAVFSTGSIAWGQALPCFETDNDVARITANVLDRFMQDGPLAL